MKRRTYLAGLGSLAAATGLTIGSGAFTSVSAERSVTVETEVDRNALLALDDIGTESRIEEIDGTVTLQFPSPEEKVQRQNLDLGLGTNSVYEFDRDANATEEGLLRITNRGTQSVEVYSEYQSSGELEIELYDVTDSSKTALRNDPVTLNVGEQVNVGFRIQTFDTGVETFNETLTIIGRVPDS